MNITGLSFSYGEKEILHNISFTLEPGTVTVLTGPSGCGKTTLLRVLAGFENLQERTSLPKSDEIAFLFQENRLFPGFTAADQLRALGPHVDPYHWLALACIEEAADTKIEELSGGMQRRVALARCLCASEKRKYLLLDEPFTGMNPELIRSIIDNIRSLNKTVLFISHDAESLLFSDRIIRFHEISK